MSFATLMCLMWAVGSATGLWEVTLRRFGWSAGTGAAVGLALAGWYGWALGWSPPSLALASLAIPVALGCWLWARTSPAERGKALQAGLVAAAVAWLVDPRHGFPMAFSLAGALAGMAAAVQRRGTVPTLAGCLTALGGYSAMETLGEAAHTFAAAWAGPQEGADLWTGGAFAALAVLGARDLALGRAARWLGDPRREGGGKQ